MASTWPPVDSDGFVPEQTGLLGTGWVPVTASITDDGTNKWVTLPATNNLQFFRLRSP